jgi:predicted DNA-binding WGR domain protein
MIKSIVLKKDTEIGTTRFYQIELLPTLFGEYLLQRVYGNTQNKKPTGIKRSFFNNIDQAKESFEVILNKKTKRGYRMQL